MHKSLDKFIPYVEKKLLRQVISPCKKLVLWNYTDLCTYERAWDKITINARGTVYELSTGKVIARAFPKFWNLGELSDEKQEEILKEEEFQVFEKMDGSLGIIYFYDGEWRVNTRGSFTSDQAIRGKEMLDTKYDSDSLNKSLTYLVEIIYPENRIIVNYGKEEKLTLLGIIKNRFGTEFGFDQTVPQSCLQIKENRAPSYSFKTIEELQKKLATMDHTEEGYVVRLKSGERVKFKSVEYLKVARIISNMTPLAMWKVMEDGKVKLDYLEQLPEEFREEAESIADQIENKYTKSYVAMCSEYLGICRELRLEDGPTPENLKKLGLYIQEKSPVHGAAHFNFLKNTGQSSLNKYIMKKIRPIGNML